MTPREALVCASASLHWYEAMFRAHGLSASIVDSVWTSRGTAPPYHSNAITVAPEPVAEQTSAIRDLRAALGRGFTVKDSFARLDLAPLGFRTLFDAEWILRAADVHPPTPCDDDLDWRRVRTEPDLARWEAAWRVNGSPADARVFLPDLLADPSVALFGAYRGDRIVAGCAANRAAEAVGFSNFFAEGDAEPHAAAAVGEVQRFAPGLPLVGYDRGDALTRLLRLGFRTVGPLRVWTFG